MFLCLGGQRLSWDSASAHWYFGHMEALIYNQPFDFGLKCLCWFIYATWHYCMYTDAVLAKWFGSVLLGDMFLITIQWHRTKNVPSLLLTFIPLSFSVYACDLYPAVCFLLYVLYWINCDWCSIYWDFLQWVRVLSDFQRRETLWSFVPGKPGQPLALHLGDYNLDGFPDALVVLRNTSSG